MFHSRLAVFHGGFVVIVNSDKDKFQEHWDYLGLGHVLITEAKTALGVMSNLSRTESGAQCRVTPADRKG